MERPVQIAIVPGHSPDDPGAGFRGIHEYPIAAVLAGMIERRASSIEGLRPYVMLREDAGGLSELVEHVNERDPDGILSLHFNAVENTAINPHGYAIVHPDGSNAAKALARYVSIEVPAPGGTRQPHRERPDLAILRDTNAAAVMDEPFFIDRQSSEIGLASLDTLADAYARTLRRWVQWETGPLGGSLDRSIY